MEKTKQLTIEDIPEIIFGFEDDGDENNSEDKSGDESQEDKEGAGGASKDSSTEHDDADDPKVRGLKKALETERATAEDFEKKYKLAEKERKRLAKLQENKELGEKDEDEQKATKLTAAEEKVARLAAKALKTSVDAAIIKAAEKANFLDPEDALAGVDRTDLAEQDDDDPSDITLDDREIEKRVKALAAKKPHYVKSGTSDNEPTGGQFGAGKKPKPKGDSKEAWKENYPGL